MLVLGIEGTAWNLSIAVVNENSVIKEVRYPYIPHKGGIHPREAAQHHSGHIAKALRNIFSQIDPSTLDGVAFSIGPGMGPCLRTVATAARTLSLALDIPLIGVNHCVAHIEVGLWKTDAKNPVVLYVSGGNSQVISRRGRFYRVFGETLDIGIGNALDKLARYAGLPHPGGPKIEKLAFHGSHYHSLPYVIKGMDFSFSGMVTAAQNLLNRGISVEDVCYSFQETAFAMLVEVTERAMAYLERDEVLLVGGVGVNARLQEMLHIMCQDRGGRFFCPPRELMGDNGAMIGYTGLKMLKTGEKTRIEDSTVKPNYRVDEVELPWM
jgi:N6-L-threonylcarbamoyladenine synthase